MKYAELRQYLVEAPLYQSRILEDLAFGSDVSRAATEGFPVPKALERHCQRCQKTTNWQWSGVPGSAESIRLGLQGIPYECKNCGREFFNVWVTFGCDDEGYFIEKVGQSPKLSITLSPDFEKALGRSKDLYIRGMATRHAGYGIGALAYFRRLIDDTIADMLGVLETAMVAIGADSAAVETVRRARAGKVFDEKVKLAGEAVPAHLRPGGVNPFADLYELYSIGLHALSDDECCEIVDAIDKAMKYVYTVLKGQAEGAAQYKEAATKIQQTIMKHRAKPHGGAA